MLDMLNLAEARYRAMQEETDAAMIQTVSTYE